MGTCETCRFCHVRWRKGDKYTNHSSYDYVSRECERAASYFECRRYAPRGPVVLTENTQGVEAFPNMSDGDWCGEYLASQSGDAA